MYSQKVVQENTKHKHMKLHLISVVSCDIVSQPLFSLLTGAAGESDVQGPDPGRQTVRHPQGGLETGQPPLAVRQGPGTPPPGKYL